MSVIWSGITEQGAVVPVQVSETGKVIATAAVTGDYVKISGDTMTGPLVLPGDPTQDLEAATKQYVDSKPSGGGQLFCSGSTNDSGRELAYGLNCASIRRISSGEYQVFFIDPAFSTDYVVLVTGRSVNRIPRIDLMENLSFTVKFNNPAGTSTDTDFGFSVFGPFTDVRVAKADRLPVLTE